ncbi:alpha/beta fold hydrolase [Streptomyces sp. NPDC001348]
MRRAALGCAVLLATVTTASFTYDAFTTPRAASPAGLRYVQAADIHTRYRTWGTTGSPVVLVHGAFEQADTWSRLAPLLARDHRVYALDLTGDGYSERRGPYTVEHFTRQLLGFLSAVHLGGPGERPLLVGHSSGAAVVADAALRAPGRVIDEGGWGSYGGVLSILPLLESGVFAEERVKAVRAALGV